MRCDGGSAPAVFTAISETVKTPRSSLPTELTECVSRSSPEIGLLLVPADRRAGEDHMELQAQVAIVTGAGRGIGRATALELARMGAEIVVAELDRANAERTATEIRGCGRRALAVPTDVTSRQDLAALVEQTRAEFGRIDILVNNAGIYRAAPTLEVTEAHWDAVMNINAKAG